MSATVILEPWGSDDLPLIERLMGDLRMTGHVGSPESPDKLPQRQGRYERLKAAMHHARGDDAVGGAEALAYLGLYAVERTRSLGAGPWMQRARPTNSAPRALRSLVAKVTEDSELRAFSSAWREGVIGLGQVLGAVKNHLVRVGAELPVCRARDRKPGGRAGHDPFVPDQLI